jgi:hypothetical protein
LEDPDTDNIKSDLKEIDLFGSRPVTYSCESGNENLGSVKDCEEGWQIY